jgi:hypothetical protein
MSDQVLMEIAVWRPCACRCMLEGEGAKYPGCVLIAVALSRVSSS